MYLTDEFYFRQTSVCGKLRGDTGDKTSSGVGQHIGVGLAVNNQGLSNFIQISISSYTRKLRGPIVPGVTAKGFVIMPKDTVCHNYPRSSVMQLVTKLYHEQFIARDFYVLSLSDRPVL